LADFLLYSCEYSESVEDALSVKVGAGGGSGGKWYIAERTAMEGDMWVVWGGDDRDDCDSIDEPVASLSVSLPAVLNILRDTGDGG
jgi:hypothetical protein